MNNSRSHNTGIRWTRAGNARWMHGISLMLKHRDCKYDVSHDVALHCKPIINQSIVYYYQHWNNKYIT